MERIKFMLSDSEEFSARFFRKHHRKNGCLFRKGLFRWKNRKVQETEPTYTYIFTFLPTGSVRKYVKCNVCGEMIEITEVQKKRSKN